MSGSILKGILLFSSIASIKMTQLFDLIKPISLFYNRPPILTMHLHKVNIYLSCYWFLLFSQYSIDVHQWNEIITTSISKSRLKTTNINNWVVLVFNKTFWTQTFCWLDQAQMRKIQFTNSSYGIIISRKEKF